MSNSIFPDFPDETAVKNYFRSDPRVWEKFTQLPPEFQSELIGFCLGKNGLRVTYDTVFKKIFDPYAHPERLESLLSALLGKEVQIIQILGREGSQLNESGHFVIMDVLTQLDDGTYADVEMQKVGYKFPIERSDCYGADVIMRQYVALKAKKGANFHFGHLQKVFCIILMEQSPSSFQTTPTEYIHNRHMIFDTGIMPDQKGLREDMFVCLDIYQETSHNAMYDYTV